MSGLARLPVIPAASPQPPGPACQCRNNRIHSIFMLPSIKVLRREYALLQQAELASFAANIVRRTLDAAAYAPVKPQVTALHLALQTYTEALADNRRTGTAQTVAKDRAKAALLAALNELASAIEQQAGDDPLYIVQAGFSRWKERVDYAGPVLPPVNLRASGTGRRGEVRLSFDRPQPTLVRSYAMQYSADNGATWKNGAYAQRSNFVLRDLPHCPSLLIRVSILATRSRQSDWSEPVVVAVA